MNISIPSIKHTFKTATLRSDAPRARLIRLYPESKRFISFQDIRESVYTCDYLENFRTRYLVEIGIQGKADIGDIPIPFNTVSELPDWLQSELVSLFTMYEQEVRRRMEELKDSWESVPEVRESGTSPILITKYR